MYWDIFISHASEDKFSVARPLAERLQAIGYRVWLDENELRLGDSLRGNIDQGLAGSRFGVVILSRAFFSKKWPQRELNGLVARESEIQKVILPVWHEVDHEFVARYSPILADKLAVNTAQGLDHVVEAIRAVIAAPRIEGPKPVPALTKTTATRAQLRGYARMWQEHKGGSHAKEKSSAPPVARPIVFAISTLLSALGLILTAGSGARIWDAVLTALSLLPSLLTLLLSFLSSLVPPQTLIQPLLTSTSQRRACVFALSLMTFLTCHFI